MKITVNADRIIGKIKPMHAVGQPPRLGARNTKMHYLTEAGIPYSRLHDVGGGFGGGVYVDIPNIFPDFDADENDPASYEFAFTDNLMEGLMEAKCEPYFRLGVTIENYAHVVKPYRIYPPKDFAKWARICEHVVRHYNEGWADGFTYGVTYWEIWNEPENGNGPIRNELWLGTAEEYYEMYIIAAKHLKACFGDTIRVGGFGSCGFGSFAGEPEVKDSDEPRLTKELADAIMERNHEVSGYRLRFFRDFLRAVSEAGAPLDFFGWHNYSQVWNALAVGDYVRTMLDRYGFTATESHMNEWNNAHDLRFRGTSYASACAGAMMLAMQDSPADMLCYYDARINNSEYGGLFSPLTWEPVSTYYSFKAFGELYRRGTQVECGYDAGGAGKKRVIYACAAKDDAGDVALMIVNTGTACEIETNLEGYGVWYVDEKRFLEKGEADGGKFTLPGNTVVLLKRC